MLPSNSIMPFGAALVNITTCVVFTAGGSHAADGTCGSPHSLCPLHHQCAPGQRSRFISKKLLQLIESLKTSKLTTLPFFLSTTHLISPSAALLCPSSLPREYFEQRALLRAGWEGQPVLRAGTDFRQITTRHGRLIALSDRPFSAVSASCFTLGLCYWKFEWYI